MAVPKFLVDLVLYRILKNLSESLLLSEQIN